MQNNQIKYYFNLEKESLINAIKTAKKYIKVNAFLKQNNWLFISPLFFQGAELDYFFKIKKKNTNAKSKITELIFHKFYDLSWAASFIDGYCKRCKHIKPFLQSIEHSLILAFQRDYEGSIKTLIPIIEGILRQYLKENGQHIKKIYPTLIKSFEYLQKDLIESYKKNVSNYFDQNNSKIRFDTKQIEELIHLQSEYYQIWFSFLTEFIKESFYLVDHKVKNPTSQLNRHIIEHAIVANIDFNLENYIKVYFVIQFLTWIFLRREDNNQLNEIKGFRFIEKVISYKNIIQLSNKILYEKHLLLKEYDGYQPQLLKEKFTISFDKVLDKEEAIIKYKLLRKINKHLWNKKTST